VTARCVPRVANWTSSRRSSRSPRPPPPSSLEHFFPTARSACAAFPSVCPLHRCSCAHALAGVGCRATIRSPSARRASDNSGRMSSGRRPDVVPLPVATYQRIIRIRCTGQPAGALGDGCGNSPHPRAQPRGGAAYDDCRQVRPRADRTAIVGAQLIRVLVRSSRETHEFPLARSSGGPCRQRWSAASRVPSASRFGFRGGLARALQREFRTGCRGNGTQGRKPGGPVGQDKSLLI